MLLHPPRLIAPHSGSLKPTPLNRVSPPRCQLRRRAETRKSARASARGARRARRAARKALRRKRASGERRSRRGFTARLIRRRRSVGSESFRRRWRRQRGGEEGRRKPAPRSLRRSEYPIRPCALTATLGPVQRALQYLQDLGVVSLTWASEGFLNAVSEPWLLDLRAHCTRAGKPASQKRWLIGM